MKKFNGGNVCFICDICRVITGYESLGATDVLCETCKGKASSKSVARRLAAMNEGNQ